MAPWIRGSILAAPGRVGPGPLGSICDRPRRTHRRVNVKKPGGWRVTPIVSGSLLGEVVFFWGLNLESDFNVVQPLILNLNPFAPRSFRVVLIPTASTCFVFHIIQAGM